MFLCTFDNVFVLTRCTFAKEQFVMDFPPFFPFYFCSIYCIVKFEDRRTLFKCFAFDGQNVLMLEKELTYLGGMCSAALMRRDISLPPGEVPATRSLAHSLTHPRIHTLSVCIYIYISLSLPLNPHPPPPPFSIISS